MEKVEIIAMLEKEKWYPMIHVTDMEFETSKLLNKILDGIIKKINVKDVDNNGDNCG